MDIITVPRPVGYLVATGQRTLLLADRRHRVSSTVLIRNHPGSLSRDETTEYGHLLNRMVADGADLGPDRQTGYDRPGYIVAVAEVRRHAFIDEMTTEDLLRSTSLLIRGKTEAYLGMAYGGARERYGIYLADIQPMPIDVPELVLDMKDTRHFSVPAINHGIGLRWTSAALEQALDVLDELGVDYV